jgi:hypothetical protein
VTVEHFAWRYLPYGHVKHAHHVGDVGPSGDVYGAALCGTTAGWRGGWFGTGTQREAERLADLPKCHRCARRAVSHIVQTRAHNERYREGNGG